MQQSAFKPKMKAQAIIQATLWLKEKFSHMQIPHEESPKSFLALVCIKFHEKYELYFADVVVGWWYCYCMKSEESKDSSLSPSTIDKVSTSASGLRQYPTAGVFRI